MRRKEEERRETMRGDSKKEMKREVTSKGNKDGRQGYNSRIKRIQ